VSLLKRAIQISTLAIFIGGAGYLTFGPSTVQAQAVGKGITNLELPRFVSLKARRANMRVGPGKTYAVSWLYTKTGLPLEVVQEFDYWRRVRDSEGTEGWLYHSLLSGKRTAVTAPWKKLDNGAFEEIVAYSKPSEDASVTLRFQPNVVAEVKTCDGNWCRITHEKGAGWVKQAELWGVYPDEKIEG
jgi:SH3-like domain-containing protein